jgi:hypothetical protein
VLIEVENYHAAHARILSQLNRRYHEAVECAEAAGGVIARVVEAANWRTCNTVFESVTTCAEHRATGVGSDFATWARALPNPLSSSQARIALTNDGW